MRKTLLLLLLVVGCAGTYTYTPPAAAPNIQNSITVDMPKSDVWNKVVQALGSSFFVVNNLEKESGFINVSYSGDPEKYVDCGEINSYVENLRGERRYVFPASTGYKDYETMKNNHLLFYKRRVDLDGRINIIIQEASPGQTTITVNTRYILNMNVLISNPQGQSENISDSASFNTNSSSSFSLWETTCCANGELEREIFSIIGF